MVQSSFHIIKFIRKLADTGMPLVCTVIYHFDSIHFDLIYISFLFRFINCPVLVEITITCDFISTKQTSYPFGCITVLSYWTPRTVGTDLIACPRSKWSYQHKTGQAITVAHPKTDKRVFSSKKSFGLTRMKRCTNLPDTLSFLSIVDVITSILFKLDLKQKNRMKQTWKE